MLCDLTLVNAICRRGIELSVEVLKRLCSELTDELN